MDRRWAIEMVVLFPLRRADSAELTKVSDSASKADVAVEDLATKPKRKIASC